jgi:3',5'-cyclic-AMP phosphodiesterase
MVIRTGGRACATEVHGAFAMPRLVWLTDIHLDFLESQTAVIDFLIDVRDHSPDAVLIGGDIASAPSLVGYLEQIAEVVDRPTYFVLGNHDFYYGSIREMRDEVARLCLRRPALRYLTVSGAMALSPQLCVIGHDGWADARTGDYERSTVMMNDYQLIDELAKLNKLDRRDLLQSLGNAAAQHIREVLPGAMDLFQQTILLTHIPPLREACWYNGETSDDEWAPHFTCVAMGAAILEIAREFPQNQLTVLCGHTHSPGRCQPLANVEIRTAGATYGQSAIAEVLEL